MSVMVRSLALLGIAVAMAGPVKADELKADEARRFIAGKHFSYSCFEGTSGHGRINADGSVAGYIKIGSNPMRYVVLPAGTLRVHGDQYCASVRGIPFEPCFNLTRTSGASFRGAISGLRFAYCDFNRGSARAEMTARSRHPLGLRLRAASATDSQ